MGSNLADEGNGFFRAKKLKDGLLLMGSKTWDLCCACKNPTHQMTVSVLTSSRVLSCLCGGGEQGCK